MEITSNNKPTPKSLEMAQKHFGNDWNIYVRSKPIRIKQPSNFLEIIALALDKLTPDEQKTLLFIFLGIDVSPQKQTGPRVVNFTVAQNNYERIYFETFNLLAKGPFPVSAMVNVFRKEIAGQQKKDVLKIEKETLKKPDSSIIDVTGQSQKLDTSAYPQSPTTPKPILGNGFDSSYKEKLNLTDEEVNILNQLYSPINPFTFIKGCCLATIRLFLATLKELDSELILKKSSLQRELEYFNAKMLEPNITFEDKNISKYANLSYISATKALLYTALFKMAENAVRDVYGTIRKVSINVWNRHGVTQEFETRLGTVINKIIQTLTPSIEPPDEKTEIDINAINKTRWKTKYTELKKNYSEQNKQAFIDAIYQLGRVNVRNPTHEDIFYEASHFMAKYDKIESMRFYLHYIYNNRHTDEMGPKPLRKAYPKGLFNTEEQSNAFDKIVGELAMSNELDYALEDLQELLQPLKKKIELDHSKIKKVQQKNKATVELLNEYLQDEEEVEKANKAVVQKTVPKVQEKKKGLFIKDVSLNEIQEDAIGFFVEKSFNVSSPELDKYCKTKGVFRNQLVDSINESCYGYLDDLLIEEEGDGFVMNEGYYKKMSIQPQ